MSLSFLNKIVEQGQANQNRTNIQLATWLMVEASELADHILKEEVYGRPADISKMIDETGDVLHFITIIAQRYGYSLEECIEANRLKLIDRGWIK